MEDILYKTVGFPLMSLITIMCYNDKDNFADIIEWSYQNEELNQKVLDITDQKMSLTGFMCQHYFSLKKKYVKKNEDKIKKHLRVLESALSKTNRFSDTTTLRNSIGSLRRLLSSISE